MPALPPRLRIARLATLLLALVPALLLAPTTHAQTPTRHTVGFSIGRVPGPGLRLEGLYRYRGLEPGTLSAGLGWSEALFGSLGYGFDVVLDAYGDRRLAFGAELFTDYLPDRLLAGAEGAETDERRTGALLRAALALQPGIPTRSIDLLAELSRVRVRLDPTNGTATSHHLTALDLTALVRRLPAARASRTFLQLTPGLRLGHEGRLFAVASFAGSVRRPLGSLVTAVVEARMAAASAAAPSYERVTFGGLQIVRGFRQDAVVGQYV